MNDNTTKLIEQLAQKLGTTSQYLWNVLLKQAPIDATITLVQTLVILIFGYILFKLHKRLSKEKDYNGYKETGYAHYEELAAFPMIIAAIAFTILIIFCFCCFSDIVNGYFNPEYWALNKVLSGMATK